MQVQQDNDETVRKIREVRNIHNQTQLCMSISLSKYPHYALFIDSAVLIRITYIATVQSARFFFL